MAAENDKRSGFHDNESQKGLIPLTPDQQKKYPSVIYELESDSPFDHALLLGSYQAMTGARFSIVAGIEGKGATAKVVVRTSATEGRDQTVESALFLGLTEATRRKLDLPVDVAPETEQAVTSQYSTQAARLATGLLDDLVSKPEMYEEFKKYYGGLRWSTDQEKFTRSLFLHGTDFDPDFLDRNLTGSRLNLLTYSFDMDIPYERRRNWDQAEAGDILEQFPELDYHRLDDEKFRATPEGQKLLKEYTKLCGDILSYRNKRGLERNITKDGIELSRPRVPLSRHPIIEALIVDELATDRPRPKYNFGPSDLTGIVLDSDSQPAHEALVIAINTRLPEDRRRVFDGPDEFEHKHRNVASVLRAYQEASTDEQRRSLLTQDVVSIMDAFTGEGAIAASVREENQDWRASSRRGEERDSPDTFKLKKIVQDLVMIGLTAPDPEIVARAEDLITQYLPSNSSELSLPDALALTRVDLMLVMIDAFKHVSRGTHPAIFESLGRKVFGNEAVADQLRYFAEATIQAMQMRNTPDVLLASLSLRKYGFSSRDNKDPEEEEARRKYDDLVRPADQFTEKQRQEKNQLLLTLLGQLTNSGVLAQSADARQLFTGFVKRIELDNYYMRELPQEYHALIDLANNPALTEQQKADILWHLQSQFEYIESEASHLLVPVILDMYQVALGPIDAVRLPDSDAVGHGLAAAAYIVGKHRKMFKAATPAQLQMLDKYKVAISEHAERIATGALLDNGEIDEDMAGLENWQKETMRHLSYVMRELNLVEGAYAQYQHMEAVKVYPHVYYPWVLQQLVPFWRKMQWEVSPGNRPSREITELHRVLEANIKSGLVIHEDGKYPEDFDVLEDGHFDRLLRECYQRMVVPHDIKYNTTVWQDGLSFVLSAIINMPPKVLEQIKAKYPNTPFAQYIEKEYERWNKEKDIH